MTRDFKIGLLAGAVLAFVALIFVVTRPTLSPQARMAAPPTSASAKEEKPSSPTPPPENTAETTPEPSRFEASIPSGGTPIEPTPAPAEEQAVEPQQTTSANPLAEIDSTIYEKDEKITTTKYHIVQKNETLSSISQLYYGTPNQWQKIVKANAGTIKDANRISPGTKLVIPE